MTLPTPPVPWSPRPEPDFVPYQPLGPLGIDSMLVLAPHPDDEVFGCGGVLALAVAQQVRVQVLVLTDGAAGGDAAVREHECRAAAQALGYLDGGPEALGFWRLPDRGLQPDESLIARLQDELTRRRPDWVLAPSPLEIHPDHRATCLAAIEACRRVGTRLGFYEVGQPLMPNCLVDITGVLPLKQRAMQCFPSQLAVQDYGEHIAALNRYRSYTLGPGVRHAEAFWLTEPADLQQGLASVLGRLQQGLGARFQPADRASA
jgi:LmbE family N-acetylglucosaminyl deacetylase